MNDEVKKSEFRKVKAKATIELTEYSDGTVECIPRYEPAFDSTLGSHVMVGTIYNDIMQYINNLNTKEGDSDNADEAGNKHSTSE